MQFRALAKIGARFGGVALPRFYRRLKFKAQNILYMGSILGI